MAITFEVTGSVKVVDTTKGQAGAPLDLTESLSITIWSKKTVTIADATSNQTIQFDSVTAAKLLSIRSDGAITAKVNGSATAIPVRNRLHITDSAGGITACTISNTSGATRTVEVVLGG